VRGYEALEKTLHELSARSSIAAQLKIYRRPFELSGAAQDALKESHPKNGGRLPHTRRLPCPVAGNER
jgi:hypothetical protein